MNKQTFPYPIEQNPEAATSRGWSTFINSHPDGNYFQSSDYFQFLRDVSEWVPFVFSALDSTNSLCGILVGCVQYNGKGLKKRFSSRIVIIGGPLVSDSELQCAEALIHSLVTEFKDKAIYIDVRNLFDITRLNAIFCKNSFIFKEHLNIRVELKTEDENLKAISKSKVRQIRSSLNEGVVIQKAENIEEVREFYILLKELYILKVKKPLPAFGFFEGFWSKGSSGILLLVKHNSKVIGGIVSPVFGSTIYEWYICGQDNYHKKIFPSVIATWAAIEYGLKQGLRYFDFLGAGSPDNDYGVREFKSKFGGLQSAPGRYIRINNYFLFTVGKLGLKVLGYLNKL
jgi:serine/alanine adding enzyme